MKYLFKIFTCLMILLLGCSWQVFASSEASNQYLGTVLLIGDWGAGGGDGDAQIQKDVGVAMQKFAAKTNVLQVISAGDNFYPNGVESTEDRHWNNFRETYGPLAEKPWLVALGNHDIDQNPWPIMDFRNKMMNWIASDPNVPPSAGNTFWSHEFTAPDKTKFRFIVLNTNAFAENAKRAQSVRNLHLPPSTPEGHGDGAEPSGSQAAAASAAESKSPHSVQDGRSHDCEGAMLERIYKQEHPFMDETDDDDRSPYARTKSLTGTPIDKNDRFGKKFAWDPARHIGFNPYKQAAFLQEQLQQKADWKIVIGHHPIFGGKKKKGEEANMQAWLHPKLRSEMDFYIAGHIHKMQHIPEVHAHGTAAEKFTDHLIVGSGSGIEAEDSSHANKGQEPNRIDEPGFGYLHLYRDEIIFGFVNSSGVVKYNQTHKKSRK